MVILHVLKVVDNVVKVYTRYTERALVSRRILLGRERAHENMEQVRRNGFLQYNQYQYRVLISQDIYQGTCN